MNESIADYIEKTFTVEMQEILRKGFALFERLNLETPEAFILNILNDIENADTVFVSTNVIGIVEGTCIQLEKSFGFELAGVDGMTLEQRIDFIRGYVDLEDYLDHDMVVRICETDSNDEEKLAEAVALTADYGEETLLSFIMKVDESALKTLQRLHLRETPNEEKNEDLAPTVAPEEQVLQIKAYELFIKQHNLTVDCFGLIRQGYPIGMSFKLYWEQYKDVILTADAATLAKEILGLFLLSKEHWTNPILAFTNISDDLFDSVKLITENNVMVRQLYSGFAKFKAENKIK